MGFITETSDSVGHDRGHEAVAKVLLVDDHAMMRQGLRSILDDFDDVEVVGEGQDGLEAVELACRLNPDVVVMDIRLPRLNGIEAARLIHQERPSIAIIALSVDKDKAESMRQVGAVACLSKEAAVDRLHGVIRQIMTAKKV
jgi:DNA-binding NarL/FixJ family response regulator